MLTAEWLRELLDYDPATGVFRWKTPRRGINVGDVAGCPNKRGYLRICVDYKLYYCQRLAWLYMTGEWPDTEIDHRDLDKTNNRWLNLRKASRCQQQFNIALRVSNTSGLKGASLDRKRGRWVAQIKCNGKHRWLGYHDTPEAAHAAYAKAAAELHGEFARVE